jgi:pyridoxal phosphate enzyme (YggS family)
LETIASALESVKRRIAAAEAGCGRPAGSVSLLAVSKTHPPETLRAAYVAGQRAFGENYLQEALAKIDALADLPIEWHFIGPIQSNKTKPIAERFAWVHSVERAKIADRLSAQRPENLPPLQVCLQVNVSGEASKSGALPEELPALAAHVTALPNLVLRGLMAIPRDTDDVAEQRAQFRALRQMFEDLRSRGFALDTLSMGMSHDLEAAVAEGTTLVRVGTAIFGLRPKKA